VSTAEGIADLVPAARLFGRLLVRELDADDLSSLRQEEVAAALLDLGVTPPDPAAEPDLAAEYCALFLHPEGALPPVQSLWTEGRYDGDAAVRVRSIAAAAGLSPSPGGAPPDHLGCILVLWAELVDAREDLATLLARDHLAWAATALAPAVRRGGFYGEVARAVVELTQVLAEEAAGTDGRPA